MSQLDQAKREAKRLFNISKESQNGFAEIKNLSHAKEIIAKINGYNSWHAYEENLKRKDVIDGGIILKSSSYNRQYSAGNSEIDENYFNRNLEFNCHIASTKNLNQYHIKHQKHTPIKVGDSREKKLFSEKKSYLLNSYPATIIGSTGAGKTESLLSCCAQYIKNSEGLIYFEPKGDPSLYSKIFGFCDDSQRLKDLFCINLRKPYESSSQDNPKMTHSIDPINCLLENSKHFCILFGEEIGQLLYSIAFECKKNNLLLDAHNLESMLMLPNLLKWAKQEIFGVATKTIKNYLYESLGLSEDLNDLGYLPEDELFRVLNLHFQKCSKPLDLIIAMQEFEDYGVFSKEPDIDLEDIFVNSKILVILFPALEKSVYTFSMIAHLILLNIQKFSKDVEMKFPQKLHGQNIIIDDASYIINSEYSSKFFASISNFNNWIFGFQGFTYGSPTCLYEALKVSNSYLLMKIEDVASSVPDFMIGRIFKSLEDNRNMNIFYKNTDLLREQGCGEAYFFCNHKALLEPIKTIYIPAKRVQRIYLSKTEPVISVQTTLDLDDLIGIKSNNHSNRSA